MKVVVVGAGGLGGYYGGVLVRAGVDVTFIARGATLTALQERGLEVRSLLSGNFTVPVEVDRRSVGSLAPPISFILTMKAYDLDAVAQSVSVAVGEATTVLTMQNGIDHIDRLAKYIPRERIVPGIIYISSTVIEPGVIDQIGGPGTIFMGEDRGGSSDRVEAIQQLLSGAGLKVEVDERIWDKLWYKFMIICAMSGVSALTRLTLQEIFDVPESRDLYLAVMEEVTAVARASGADLPLTAAAEVLHMLENMPMPAQRGSMAFDLLAGRRLELDVLNGTVVKYADRFGVDVPMNLAIYRALKPFAGGRTPAGP